MIYYYFFVFVSFFIYVSVYANYGVLKTILKLNCVSHQNITPSKSDVMLCDTNYNSPCKLYHSIAALRNTYRRF